MIRGKRIFISGGAGFIGTNLVERLVDRNEVVVYDNLHRDALRREDAFRHRNLKFVRGDVRNGPRVRKAMDGCSLVVHLAAIAGVDTVMSMPVKTMTVSMLGTYNVLEAARAQKRMERVIDFSTSEVFGSYAYNVQEGDTTTLGAVGEARWTYAVSKLATEHLALSYQREFALPALSIRPFNIYGPRQVGSGAIHHFIVHALRNEPLQIHNDGGQIRAWCYVDDIVDAVLLALERKESVGQVFNIGNPRSVVTIYQLAKDIVRICQSRSRIRFVKWGGKDVEIRIPNIEKARKLLGFKPRVDLEVGLLRTADWYRRQLGL